MVYNWKRGFEAGIWVFISQLCYGMFSFLGWKIPCLNGCPSRAIPTWSLAVLGAVSISLSVIAVILTCCNWLVVYWVFTQKCKDIICNRRIFQNDVVVKIATAYLISFFGLLLMVLVALVLALPICQIRQNERLWDTVYFGWAVVFVPYHFASWNLMTLFFNMLFAWDEYDRSQVKTNGGITEKSRLLPPCKPSNEHEVSTLSSKVFP